jgi:hypothetical protein
MFRPTGGKWYFDTPGAARRSLTCAVKRGALPKNTWVVTTDTEFERSFVRKTVVKNLMSGQPVEITTDTPHCCDPSSETYWSM